MRHNKWTETYSMDILIKQHKIMYLKTNMIDDGYEILRKRTRILKNLAFNFTGYSHHWIL